MKLSCTKYMLFLAVALLLLGVAACTQQKPVVPTATIPLGTPGLPPPAVGTANPAATTVGPANVTVVPAATAKPGTAVPSGQGTPVAPTQPTMLPTPTSGAGAPQPTQAAPVAEATAVPTEASGAPVAGTCTNPYTVQRGEWLYSIARKCGVTPGAIMAANPMVNLNTLYPGQSLVMPGATSGGTTPGGATGGNTYVVQRGDTMFSIARRFNVTVQALMAINGISNPNFIFAGQVLTIPQ